MCITRSKVTIQDTSTNGGGKIKSLSRFGVVITGAATVIIEKGSFEGIMVTSESSLTINDGVFTEIHAVSLSDPKTDLTVNGGTFKGTNSDLQYGYSESKYEGITVTIDNIESVSSYSFCNEDSAELLKTLYGYTYHEGTCYCSPTYSIRVGDKYCFGIKSDGDDSYIRVYGNQRDTTADEANRLIEIIDNNQYKITAENKN